MRKVKVLQFPIANSYGGITHYALNNWKWMDKEKFQCDFATMSKKLDFADEILKTGSKIHYISCYAEENEKQFVKDINKILDEGYDVVHLHTKQWKSFLVEKLCREHQVPKIIVHSHSTRCDANDDDKRERETREHERVKANFNTSYATDFWACSNEAAQWLFGNHIPKKEIVIMRNAIEIDNFLFQRSIREQIRNRLGIQNKYVIGNTGRMVYQKNQEFLLKSFAMAYKEKPELELLIIGDGELEEQLKKQVKELNIEQAVLFLGKRTDVDKLYQAMDLFVLPSRFEGMPITLVEAQTSGLKCLCSDTITREANVAGYIKYLPLNENIWKDELLNHAVPYERVNMEKLITDAGYNIKFQIKEIEEGYLR